VIPDTGTSTRVQQLWAALHQARTGELPCTLAHIEDALFRYHLPIARTAAQQHAPDTTDPDGTAQAAEVGLAQAILGWRRQDPDGFDRFARAAITAQLRHHDHLTRRVQRPRPASRQPVGAPDS
jgi:hypothetical protein